MTPPIPSACCQSFPRANQPLGLGHLHPPLAARLLELFLERRYYLSRALTEKKLTEKKMKEVLIIFAIFVVWLVLQLYILPKLGIST